jgi:hypothetical protein
MLFLFGNFKGMILTSLKDTNLWKIKKNNTRSGSIERRYPKRVQYPWRRRREERRPRKMLQRKQNDLCK